MIQRVVRAVLRMPAFVLLLAAGILGIGLYCYKQLDIEAYPNPVPPMIEIITQPNGWSAEEVERYVTVPLENALNGMIDLDHIRSQSLFGLSDVKCYFTWNVEYHLAQQRVLNRLNFVTLPPGVTPQLSPWSAIGEVYRYVVRGDGYSLTALKTAEDWTLERQFRQAPGVIDVVGFGGYTKEYHVEVDPYRLRGHNVTLNQLTAALANANQNVGGQRLTLGEQAFNVRGIGLIRSINDIRQVVVAEQKGTPIRVRDVAEVSIGHAPRLGIVGKDLEPDVVQGTILMRYGGDSLKTLANVHDKVQEITRQHVLPPGMRIEPYYDRATLVELTTHTVIENLIVGMLLVAIVLWFFLGHSRAALITAVNIPLALMLAFIGMVATGTPANLISLGAVDFGIVVDSTVIMMENIFRHMSMPGKRNKIERILLAASEVGPPMFSSTLVIGVAFIPLFTLTGVAGVIFSPMAHTYAFAIGGAIILALMLTPVLAERGLSVSAVAEHEHEPDNILMRGLKHLYLPLFAFSLRRKRTAVAIGAVFVLAVLAASGTLGREFMPKLEEGNFWIRASLPMSISLEQSSKYVGRMRAIILGCPADTNIVAPPVDGAGGSNESQALPPGPVSQCDMDHRTHPEVTSVVSQLGRPDDGTDVSGFYNIELFAPLRPQNEWRRGVTKDSMTAELSRALTGGVPGCHLQLLADDLGQRRRGDVRGEGREHRQGGRPGPHRKREEGQRDRRCDVDYQRRRGPGPFSVAGAAQHSDHARPGAVWSLWSERRRCRRRDPGGNRRAGGHAGIRGRASVRPDSPLGAVVSERPAIHSSDPRLDARRRADSPRPAGADRRRGGAIAHLSRGQPSIRAREVLGAWPGPGVHHRRSAKEDRRPGQAALRHAPRVGRRDQSAKRGHGPAGTHHSDHAAGDRHAGLFVGEELEGHADRARRHPGRVLRRNRGLADHAHQFLHLGGDGVHFDLRNRRARRPHRRHVRAAHVGGGARTGGGRTHRGGTAASARLMTTFVAMLGLTPAALSHGIGADTQKPLAIVVIGGALILAILPRLLQPPLLVLAHARERRWTRRSEAQRILDAKHAESTDPALPSG